MNLGNIVGVWAHPDDETYLSAGIMLGAARAGARVACITATRGELGVTDPARWSSETLGQIREAELMECLELIGVEEHTWLDYPDGGLTGVDDDEAVARIAAIIGDVRPKTVLTFGPDGMTGHDDHKVVSDWASRAFAAAAPIGASLYFATHTPQWRERFIAKLDQADVFFAGEPDWTPVEELALHLELEGDDHAIKIDAIRAHVSQVDGLVEVFGLETLWDAMREECFVLGSQK